ncbi:MAG TPA: YCF48-related protein [Ignavibacteria bacterium]|nr:YCF48-related protein [Ignavibacteria bacterium]
MNFLKISFIISTLLLFCLTSFSQSGWVSQSSGTSEHLRSVFFLNDMTGWAVGYAGKILKTTNGGTNWISQTSPTSNPLLSVFFISSLAGWAVGGLGDIIATGNGGTTWTLQTTGSSSALNSVYFISASTGWAVGEFMVILKTTNSGTNWFPLLSGSVPLNSVIFTSVSTGYIAGNSGYVMKTTNGGTNWTVQNSNVDYFLYSIHFPAGSVTTGYVVGMGTPSPPILKSTNSGMNWTIQPVPLGNALTSVYFTSVSTGWAAGWIGTIMYTSNGGTNWSDQSSGTPYSLRSIYFVNSLTGWTVGDLGTILKTSNGGISALNPISNMIPEHYSLYQNYPNPFNPTTKIRFSIPAIDGSNGDVSLKIYDNLGREAATLVNEKLKPGIYEAEFDGSNLSSGVYFYRLSAGIYNEVMKMIMVK